MGPVVLVVEDEKDLVATYERLLRRQGCSVTAAGTIHDGLAALETGRVALVIADLRLPDGSGLAVVRAARERANGPPVIVVTGFASEQSRREALDAGATAYMAKPFSALALASLIQEVLATPSA
ncbi:MAG: response regulator transcription factor [Gammaproteobacteria bacterium]